jgi:hypothetical protein
MKRYIQEQISKTIAILEVLAAHDGITAAVENIAKGCCSWLHLH